MQVDQNYLY